MNNKPTNKALNQLREYKDKICIFCGRSFPHTTLNILGHIDKNLSFQCVDTMECKTYRKAKGLKQNETR